MALVGFHRACRGREITQRLPAMPQADAELQRLLPKSPDATLHLLGDRSHRCFRLGVCPQVAVISLSPGATFTAALCFRFCNHQIAL